MNLKKIAGLLFLVLGFSSVMAQKQGTNPAKAVPVKTTVQPMMPSTADVKLNQEEPKTSTFGKTMNYLGTNMRQSLEVTLETFLPFQFKYAIMLNESVEKLTNVSLYKAIDDWYGTRYRYGGTTHRGIDCSAFMQVLGEYAFGWMLPRTARAQYAFSQRINKEELKEGDLVFFNTTGGISHVGMYLQNGKFVHSSSSQGVSISSLEDQYWKARFIGARRPTANEDEEGNQNQNLN
jgi:murein DD-endopeptidase / murein LD-carboxypeptidase